MMRARPRFCHRPAPNAIAKPPEADSRRLAKPTLIWHFLAMGHVRRERRKNGLGRVGRPPSCVPRSVLRKLHDQQTRERLRREGLKVATFTISVSDWHLLRRVATSLGSHSIGRLIAFLLNPYRSQELPEAGRPRTRCEPDDMQLTLL